MARRARPQRLLVVRGEDFLEEEEEEEGWCRVKRATPVVTRKTTRYL